MIKSLLFTSSLLVLLNFTITAQRDTTRLILNAKEITSFQMKKVNPKNATLSRELYLKPKDIIAFVNQWNACTKDTTPTIKPEYFFFVTLSNKGVKYFAAGANQITENKCQLSSPDNAVFFDKLWNSLRE